jgi:hypothetical protein
MTLLTHLYGYNALAAEVAVAAKTSAGQQQAQQQVMQ